MLITVHRWFANKSCPGNWLYARLGDLAEKVTAQLGGGSEEVIPSGMQAREFQNLTEAQVVAKVGALFTSDQKKSGILASVSMAQFILESGYGKSELALGANNCFGMKKSLSGNTWGGSTWDGVSVYTKKTQEQNADGSYATSLTYVEKLCGIIERWNLTKWDVKNSGSSDAVVKYYRVRKAWKDAGSQLGAYTVLDNAKAMADKHE